MALSEAQRRDVFESSLIAWQKIADFALKRCNGHDEPFVWSDGRILADSTMAFARTVKEDTVDRLARLRAGASIEELRS